MWYCPYPLLRWFSSRCLLVRDFPSLQGDDPLTRGALFGLRFPPLWGTAEAGEAAEAAEAEVGEAAE
jgi:hypothetical protein